mgnify:CR=1 FL=1
MRNADPADDASAREVINNLFFSEKRYDLGEVGRYRINKEVGADYGYGCEGIDKTRYYRDHQVSD